MSCMKLHQLNYFVALARLEHYTKAAEEIGISQPTLSHAIAGLEEELGVPVKIVSVGPDREQTIVRYTEE